jgi:hypothetical protein
MRFANQTPTKPVGWVLGLLLFCAIGSFLYIALSSITF